VTTNGARLVFDGCRARVDELLDACVLDRDEKDALWLWASGRRERLTRQPPLLATSEGEGDDEAW
jgi:hypothetical protein